MGAAIAGRVTLAKTAKKTTGSLANTKIDDFKKARAFTAFFLSC